MIPSSKHRSEVPSLKRVELLSQRRLMLTSMSMWLFFGIGVVRFTYVQFDVGVALLQHRYNMCMHLLT